MSNFVRKKVYISGINPSLTAQEAVRVLSLAAGVSMDDVRLHLAVDSGDRSLGYAVLSVAARAALDFLSLNDYELCGRRLEVRWAHEKPVQRPCRWSVVENGVRAFQHFVSEEKTEPLAPFRYRMVDCGFYLTDPGFQMDLETVLARAVAAGMERLVVKSRTIADSEEAAKLADLFPGTILFTAGVHPSECRTWNKESGDAIRRLLEHPGCVGVGECGLDFTWLQSERDCQLEVFEAQVNLACELKKALLVYEKNAHEAVWQSLERLSDKGILPSTAILTYSKEKSVLDRYLARNYFIIVTGYTYTYPFESPISAWLKTNPSAEKLRRLLLASNAPRDCVEFAARALENHRLTMLTHESECHALTPRSLELFRTLAPSRNEPASQPCLLELVASQARLGPVKMADLLFSNAQRFFQIESLPPAPDHTITYINSDQLQDIGIDQAFVLEETLETGEEIEKKEGLAGENFDIVEDGSEVLIMMENPFGDDVAIIHCISNEVFTQMQERDAAKQTTNWVDHVTKVEYDTAEMTRNQQETRTEKQEATTTSVLGRTRLYGVCEKEDMDAWNNKQHDSPVKEEIPGSSVFHLLTSRFKVEEVDTEEAPPTVSQQELTTYGNGGAAQSLDNNVDELLEDLKEVVLGPRTDSTFHTRDGATIYTDIVRVPPPSGSTASQATWQDKEDGSLTSNDHSAAAATDMEAEEDVCQIGRPTFNSKMTVEPLTAADKRAPDDQTALAEEENEKESTTPGRQSSEESVQANVRDEGAREGKCGERAPLGSQYRPWATAEEKAAFQAGGMLEISTEGQVAMKTPIEDEQAASEDSDVERAYSSAHQSLHASNQELSAENADKTDEEQPLLQDEETVSEENLFKKAMRRHHSISSLRTKNSLSQPFGEVLMEDEEMRETTRAWSQGQVGQEEISSSKQPSKASSLASNYGSATDDPGILKKPSVTTKPKGVDPAVRSRVDSYLRSLEQDSVTTPRSKERVAELRTIGGLQYQVWKRMERFELGAQPSPSEEKLSQEDSRTRVAEIQKLNTVSVKARSSLFDKGAIQNLSEMSFPKAPCPSASSTAPGEESSRSDGGGQGEVDTPSCTAAQVLQQLTQLAVQRESGSLPRQASPPSLTSGASEPDYHKNREHLGKLLCKWDTYEVEKNREHLGKLLCCVRERETSCSAYHASLGDMDPDLHLTPPRSKMAARGARETIYIPEEAVSPRAKSSPPPMACKSKEHLKTLRPSESSPERSRYIGQASSSRALRRSTPDNRAPSPPHALRPSREETNLPAVPRLVVKYISGQNLLVPRRPSRERAVNVVMPPHLALQHGPSTTRLKPDPSSAEQDSEAASEDQGHIQRQPLPTSLDLCNIPDKYLAVIKVTKKLSKDSAETISVDPDPFNIPDKNLAVINVTKKRSNDLAEASSTNRDPFNIPDKNLAIINVTKKRSNDLAEASSTNRDPFNIPDKNLAIINVTKKRSNDLAEASSTNPDPFNIPDKNLAIINVTKEAVNDSAETSSMSDPFRILDENLALIKLVGKAFTESAGISESPSTMAGKNIDQKRSSDAQAAQLFGPEEAKETEEDPVGRRFSQGANEASKAGLAVTEDEDVLDRAMPELATKVALLESVIQEIESRSPPGRTSTRGQGQGSDATTDIDAGGQCRPATSGRTDRVPETKSKILNRALAAIRACTHLSSATGRTVEVAAIPAATTATTATTAEEVAPQPPHAPTRTRSSHQHRGPSRHAMLWHDPWTTTGSITSCVAAEREARKEREIAELMAKFKRLSQESKSKKSLGQAGSSRVQDAAPSPQDSAPDQTSRQGQLVQSRRRLGPRSPRHRVREGGTADMDGEASAGNRASVHMGELDGHDIRLEANGGARRSASTPRSSRENENSSRSGPVWPILVMLGFASTPFTLTYWLEKSWPEILSYLLHLPW